MESYKGPNGGVRLSKDPKTISFLEIVEAIDGEELLRECVIGLPGCGTSKPCPMHDTWAKTRDNIREMFESTNLKQVAEEGISNNLRLSMNQDFNWS